MKQTDTTTMTRYLLGQLPEAERDAREQEWFTDQAQYVQLCEAETALIDAYVGGALRREEEALFEQHFLTIPARRDRVNTARALRRMMDQNTAPAKSWGQWLRAALRVPALVPAVTMAGLMLLVAGGLWSFWQNRKLAAQLGQTARAATEQQRRTQELEQALAAERAANARLTEELARRNDAPLSPPTAAAPVPKPLLFVLTAGVLRSASGDTLPTLKLAHDTERVQLQVKLPRHGYDQFAATLRTAEGRDVQRWTVKAAGTRLSLSLAAQQLKQGDYLLVVNGIKAQGDAEEFRRVPFQVHR